MRFKIYFTLIFFLGISCISNAQYYSFSKLVQAAESSYDQNQYLLAVERFNEAEMQKGKLQKMSLYKYADALYQINDLEEAETRFMAYLENDKIDNEDEVLIRLIKIRQRQERYDEAILDCNIYLSEYEDLDSLKAKDVKFIKKSCQWALAYNDKDMVDTIENMNQLNTAYSEQAPFFFNDSLYFNKVDKAIIADKQKTYVSRISTESGEEIDIDGISDQKFLSHPSFSNDGKYFMYSVGDYNQDSELAYDLYFSVMDKDMEPGVTRKMPEPINADSYSSMHAVMVPLDTLLNLYFSSNMPGGKGGYDLYKAVLSSDMVVQDLINLEEVNTSGDELSPYLNLNTNDLYFSSNGHPGFGGFDVFRIDLDDELENIDIENVGKWINSPLDDLFFRSNENGSKVYFTSNRPGSAFLDSRFESCCFDIYTAEVTECSINLLALIYDRSNEQILDGSYLAVIDPETQDTVFSGYAEENLFEVELECDKEYIIETTKEGYDLDQLSFLPSNFSYGQDNEIIRKIYLDPSIYDLNLSVLSKDTNLPLDSLDIVLTDMASGEEQLISKHPSSKITLQVLPGNDYRIDVSRRGYRDTFEFFNPGRGISVIDKTMFLEEKEIIKQAKITLAEAIPVALFFDHDAPGAGDSLTSSALNYSDSYEAYYEKRGRYVFNYVSKFSGSRKDNARREASQFFDNEVKAGFEKYDLFKTQLLLVLESGQTVNVYLRGYASPIALDEYNKALGRRRVDSVRREFDDWNDGALLPYIESGQLLVTERSFGEETSPSEVSDDPAQPYQSIYSPSASRERRVEIDEINFNDQN